MTLHACTTAKPLALVVWGSLVLFSSGIFGQDKNNRSTTDIPPAITTPDKVESPRLGTLRFDDGYPTKDTADKIRDELDYLHGVEAFMNSIQGVSLYALRKGFDEQGVKDNEFLIYPSLMDSRSLFLTANADTVYFWGNLNLKDGPLVVETPPQASMAARKRARVISGPRIAIESGIE